MRNTLETRLGIFFALAVIVGALILETIGSLDFFRRGRTVSARFDNILELKVGDGVKMAGKAIGRVTAIEFADARVLVEMKITEPTAVIRTDSRATIKFSGLMGQNYVAIDFGPGKGAVIDETGTELESYAQADLNMLLSRLEGATSGIQKLTESFSDSNLGEVLLPFTDFLNESKPRLLNVLTNAERISAQVAAGEGTVGKLIYEDSLYTAALSTVTNLSSTADDVRQLVSDAQATVADVRAGRGTVGRLMTDETLFSEVTEAATNLREVMQKINRGQGTVGKAINDDALINNAKLTLQKLDKATEGLEDQGPLTVLGILVNPLF